MATIKTVLVECDVCGVDGAERVLFAAKELSGHLDLCEKDRAEFDTAMEPWLQALQRVVQTARQELSLAMSPASRKPMTRVPCPVEGCRKSMPKGNIARHVKAAHPEAA